MSLKIKIIALIGVVTFLLFYNLAWLSGGLIIFASLHFLYNSNLKLIQWVKARFIPDLIFKVFSLLTTGLFIKLFIFEIFAIPSGSMEDALYKGDKIIVSKLNYGPKLPQNPFDIPWVNIVFYLHHKALPNASKKRWNYCRLSGFRPISKNDIVVFTKPDNPAIFFIKRCIGLPGDTLQVLNSQIYINGDFHEEVSTVKKKYIATFKKKADIKNNLIVSKNYPVNLGLNKMKLFLSEADKKRLHKSGTIDTLENILTFPDDKTILYPYNEVFHWSIDSFGPIVVPAKGMVMNLTKENYILYERLLNNVEEQFVTEKSGNFYKEGKIIHQITFKKNYFFLLGDNRYDSEDSRFFGFISEENIEGKATMVLFSYDTEGFIWDRFLKKL